ncbi:hypothetical protein HK104_007279 [Borealophlyctis nickersoniae]|nr:hypothetical protein HK104_007279 [Borealophlyctis nickersoniae]
MQYLSESHTKGVEEVLILLGNPKGVGLTRLREIMVFPCSVRAGCGRSPASFQRVVVLLIKVLTAREVTQSVMKEYTNAIYGVVEAHTSDFLVDKVLTSLKELWELGSVEDPTTSESEIRRREGDSVMIPTGFAKIFLHTIRLLYEILVRIKRAASEDFISQFAVGLSDMVRAWLAESPADPTSNVIKHELDRVLSIIRDGRRPLLRGAALETYMSETSNRLQRTSVNQGYRAWDVEEYDPPGELCPLGHRHDNDFADISEISVVPTMQEILAIRPPFLPGASVKAPHHLPLGPARHLDSQFRLLREDMIHPIREGITNLLRTLNEQPGQVKGNGKFRANGSGDAADLHIYRHVSVAGVGVDKRDGVMIDVRFDPPEYGKRFKDEKGRVEFWKRSKRLMHGGLVCVLWRKEGRQGDVDGLEDEEGTHSLIFAVVVGRWPEELGKSASASLIRLKIVESKFFTEMLMSLVRDGQGTGDGNFLVEASGIFFESYRPILETLKSVTPQTLPFIEYLAPESGVISNVMIPPAYARNKWDLSRILNGVTCDFRPCDSESRQAALRMLDLHSSLDEGQREALLDCLSREVALVQGPPGTGKTFLGIQLVRILLSPTHRRKTIPILCICQTNHALDQFLEHLLDIDAKIVRIGSRSKSERVEPFHIEKVCQSVQKSGTVKWELGQLFKKREECEQRVARCMEQLEKRWLRFADVQDDLMAQYYEHYVAFQCQGVHVDDGFEISGNGRKEDILARWTKGDDLREREELIMNLQMGQQRRSENPFDVLNDDDGGDLLSVSSFVRATPRQEQWHLLRSQLNAIQEKDRPIEDLLRDPNVWEMSRPERLRLHDHWRESKRQLIVEYLETLSAQLREITKTVDNLHTETRRNVLESMDVIGVTTTGAAKYTDLLRAIGPKIVICEEAGEVLEAHILAALTPSTQHLILIGDPQQLRPSIASYKLSMNSETGKSYMLDQSLLERLCTPTPGLSGAPTAVPMSKLNTQRRMRPEIADLVRIPLYPNLVDADVTKKYPDVAGMAENVYFMHHTHPEDGGDNPFAAKSHANEFEAKMVVGLVEYLIRNGYKAGDIAVLTPYLGQLLKLRDALRQSFTVVLDERDAEEVALAMGEEAAADTLDAPTDASQNRTVTTALKKSLQDQVILRTVDNFQGEESKIVIISLVRNELSAIGMGRKSTIGFLNSDNRTNVLLSRAQHGMYMLGNADLLARRSNMWDKDEGASGTASRSGVKIMKRPTASIRRKSGRSRRRMEAASVHANSSCIIVGIPVLTNAMPMTPRTSL